MKTITTQQNSSHSEKAAINDSRLSPVDVLLLLCINRVLFYKPFTMTGEEIESRWSVIKKSTANSSINKLIECGYVKREYDNTLFARSRSLTTEEHPVKPVVDNTDRDAMFEKMWDLYKYKKDRKSAEKIFNRLKPEERELAMKAIPSYLANLGSTSQAHLSTWLNKERFNDEVKSEVHISQRVVKHVAPVKTREQIQQDRDEHERWELRRAEQLKAIQDRKKEFGYQREFPSFKDKKDNDARVNRGMPSDIEAVLTARLKRERKQYKK
jgi:hypothetical protein